MFHRKNRINVHAIRVLILCSTCLILGCSKTPPAIAVDPRIQLDNTSAPNAGPVPNKTTDVPGVPPGGVNWPAEIPFPNDDLELAVRIDDSASVESLLLADVSVQGMTKDGNSLLHLGAMHADPRTAMLLLKWGADPDAVSLGGETPIDILQRQGFVSSSMAGLSFSEVLHQRMVGGIDRAFELAQQLVHRGNELAALRRQMLADFEVDRERFRAQAAVYSFRNTGIEVALPMRFWDVPTEERPPGWMANYKTTDTLPQARLKSEPVPLHDDFDSPLELPTPSQFDEAIKITKWAVIQAGLAHGVSSPKFRQVLQRAKHIVGDAAAGKLR